MFILECKGKGMFFAFLAAFKAIFLGAIYGRMDGGGIVTTKEWTERSLIMFFFVLACAPFAGLWALFAYAGVLGIATGHGQFFLNRAVQAVEPEKLDYVVRIFFGLDPRTDEKYIDYRDYVDWYKDNPGKRKKFEEVIKPEIELRMQEYGTKRLYWRNVVGMFATGLLVGIPAAILSIAFGKYILAFIFMGTGLAKAAAYVIGYEVWKSTKPAEYINGGLRNLLCSIVIALQFWSILAAV